MREITRSPVTGPSAWNRNDLTEDRSWIVNLNAAHSGLKVLVRGSRRLPSPRRRPAEKFQARLPAWAWGVCSHRATHAHGIPRAVHVASTSTASARLVNAHRSPAHPLHDPEYSIPLSRYAGGGQGWGFARRGGGVQRALVARNPHPNPPPAYRERGPCAMGHTTRPPCHRRLAMVLTG